MQVIHKMPSWFHPMYSVNPSWFSWRQRNQQEGVSLVQDLAKAWQFRAKTVHFGQPGAVWDSLGQAQKS